MLIKKSDYVKMVKTAGTEVLKKSLIKGIASQLPFLASGPWGIVLGKLATWLAEKAAEQTEMAAFFGYVDYRGTQQAEEFEQAMINNYNIQQNGTQEQKDEAKKLLHDALTNLVALRN